MPPTAARGKRAPREGGRAAGRVRLQTQMPADRTGSWRLRGGALESGRPGMAFLAQSPVVCLWTSHLTSLNLGFLLIKSLQGFCEG